eukprot:c20585_g2_i4.p4 GENE.c20585_g2_i4~~c20585_g2_i4.p4  ORF type:complete len:227 (+),score=25.34 c20585_g2_i4:1103-1783(+)
MLFVSDSGRIRAVQLATAAVRTLARSASDIVCASKGLVPQLAHYNAMVVGPCGTLLCGGTHHVAAVAPFGPVSTLIAVDGVQSCSCSLALAFNGVLVSDSSRLHYLGGAGRPPRRYNPLRPMEVPAELRQIVQTFAVLWAGRSARLIAQTVRGIRRDNCLELALFVHLVQWVQGALWPVFATPVFESMPFYSATKEASALTRLAMRHQAETLAVRQHTRWDQEYAV